MRTLLHKILYKFHSGKNPKYPYYIKAAIREIVPPCFCRHQLRSLLAEIDQRYDRDEILARADYYCKLEGSTSLPDVGAIRLGDFKMPRKQRVYYFDAWEYLRYFAPDLRFMFYPGDQTTVPAFPGITKSRPIIQGSANQNSVLLKMSKIRHFVFVDDPVPFAGKRDSIVFRGKVHAEQPHRVRFFEKFFGTTEFNIGDTSRKPINQDWAAAKMTIAEQLRYKFILSLEGNDVASNLKWIFSSNSLPIMPKPNYEIWFQEGLLVPDKHYIEIKPDYSDILEKMAFYASRPDLCEKMNHEEHKWVARFQDTQREKLVALKTLDKYFRATN